MSEPAGSLRVLHVGSGYRPLRWGGLVAYVEDLMHEQVRSGNDVSYLFSGRYFRWPKAPRLRRWSRDGVEMLEVVNSPLYDHGRQPELEISEPSTERIFTKVLDEHRPEVVHIHELAGLPSSLVDLAKDTGVPVVITLQDYFPLCSTFKLLDADGQVCLRREIGVDCAATIAADDRPANLLLEGTLRHELVRRPPLARLSRERRNAIVDRLVDSPLTRVRPGPPAPPAAYQRRREVNVERLNRADRVIAMSQRVAEIYAELGVGPDRLTTMHLTLEHISRLTPRSPSGTGPVTFATLGGGESPAKGSRLLAQAVRTLADKTPAGAFRLLIFGQCEPELARVAEAIDAVELRGIYRAHQLDALLNEVDVGIMSSIWEEAYGYAGIEFVAKGIPVLANRIGGIVDYVRDGETGWLNGSNSARGMTELMAGLVDDPKRVEAVARTTLAARDELIESMDSHARAVERLYRDLLAGGYSSASS
jgi:glycosyltransferase involved in cell wall biosynthesis